jgi:hypothetical protein
MEILSRLVPIRGPTEQPGPHIRWYSRLLSAPARRFKKERHPTAPGQIDRCSIKPLLGPFWRMNSPKLALGASIAREGTPGIPLHVSGTVTSEGRPVEGATVDIWQADPRGTYDNQIPDLEGMNLRGQFRTDADGSYSKPGFRTLVTQIFVDDTSQLESDVTFSVTPGLIGHLKQHTYN